ncbi:hypothetical protein P879_01995, partial [Paragonimus westermani]
ESGEKLSHNIFEINFGLHPLRRFQELSNGLRVILVSNPKDDTAENDSVRMENSNDDMASAAVCVRVGSFNDPDCAPGLSNLLSRMLLLSNEASDDFQVHVSAYGGQCGSYTTNEYTCYYFQVEAKQFQQCLERFVSHLCEPTLCVSRIEEQVKKIDEEFSKMKQRDYAILRQFVSNLAKEKSPFNRFHKGNQSSLRGQMNRQPNELRDMLLEHFKNNYSAHLITLAVQSSAALDEMELLVKQLFTSLPKNPVVEMNPTQYADSFSTPDFYQFYEVNLNKAKETLRMIWSLPCLRLSYRANPMLILSSLIKNMHEGSLAHHLEDNHLATDLECDFGTLCEFTNSTLCTMLVVRMNLTQTGTQRVPEICEAVYDYLKFLTKEAEHSLTNPERNKWGFLLNDDPHTFTTYVRELQIVQEGTFVDQPVHSAAVTTTWLANMMHRVVPQDLYCGYLLIKEANFQLYHELFGRLSKQKACIIRTSPSPLKISQDNRKGSLTEPWYQTVYKKSDVPEEITEGRLREKPELRFSLPAKNRLILEKFTELPCSNETKARILRTFVIRFTSGTPLESSKSSSLLLLFVEDVRFNLNKLALKGEFKRMKHSIQAVDDTVQIRVTGPSEYLREFYHTVVSHTCRRSTSIDLEHLGELRATVTKKLKRDIGNLDSWSKNILHFVTHNPAFLLTDQLDVLSYITTADLMAFSSQLLCQLRITAYGAGDIESEEIKNMFDRTIRSVSCIPLMMPKEVKVLPIPLGVYRFDQTVRDETRPVTYYVRNNISFDTHPQAEAYNRAIVNILNKESANFFRQTSSFPIRVINRYIRSAPSPNGYAAISTCVQLDATTSHLHNSLNMWVGALWNQVVPHIIASMEAIELQKLRVALAAEIRKCSTSFEAQLEANWHIILKNGANFAMVNELLFYVNGLTKENLLQFFQRYYLTPETRRSIIVCISSTAVQEEVDETNVQKSEEATEQVELNLKQFLRSGRPNLQAINNCPELQAAMKRSYPENITHIYDLRAFKKKSRVTVL